MEEEGGSELPCTRAGIRGWAGKPVCVLTFRLYDRGRGTTTCGIKNVDRYRRAGEETDRATRTRTILVNRCGRYAARDPESRIREFPHENYARSVSDSKVNLPDDISRRIP